ncbi:MAG: hypothetical protein NVS9B15_20490 [Acidobacteriaceae bacterium]
MAATKLCHRCGNSFEEGAAFCPTCGAPQIRVALPEVETPSPEASAPSDGTLADPSRGILWQRAFLAAFVPALVAVFLMEFGAIFTYTFPLWIGVAGYVSVVFYHRRAPHAHINTAIGTRLGAVTGICCFGLDLLRIAISYLVQTATGHSVRADVMAQINKSMAQNPNPQAVQFAHDFLSRPSAFPILITTSLMVLLILFVLCAVLGGALAGTIQSRRPRT